MEKDYKNKKLEPDRIKEPEELQEFHFPGDCHYNPMTIKAKNITEAIKKWEQERIAVEINN